MDIVFLITTYNREESCQRLVDSLQGQGDIIVLNDGCDYIISGCNQYFLSAHNGKQYYWATVNWLFNLKGKHRYYFMLPDDFLPTPDMVNEAISIWNLIKDPRKICLNLYADRIGVSCWTHVKPIDKGNYYHTQWMDMCFMCEERFFNILGMIPMTFFGQSSGVGAYISNFLHKRSYNLYQVKESLVTIQPSHWISQMYNKNQKDDNSRCRKRSVPHRVFDTRRNKSRRTGR